MRKPYNSASIFSSMCTVSGRRKLNVTSFRRIDALHQCFLVYFSDVIFSDLVLCLVNCISVVFYLYCIFF